MNESEEYKNNYYAIIPATVRYDKELKPAEKLIYGEITSLTNRMGYCFATNKYFANLYNVTNHTVSQWISHLEKKRYIQVDLIRNDKKEIKERRIFIQDIPYIQKNTYPYVLKSTKAMYEKIQDNNKYNKDDLYLLILEESSEIPFEFYNVIEKLEFIYSEKMLNIMQKDKIDMIKDIVYVLYDLYNSEFKNIVLVVERESLIKQYILSKENEPYNLISYFKKSIINQFMT